MSYLLSANSCDNAQPISCSMPSCFAAVPYVAFYLGYVDNDLRVTLKSSQTIVTPLQGPRSRISRSGLPHSTQKGPFRIHRILEQPHHARRVPSPSLRPASSPAATKSVASGVVPSPTAMRIAGTKRRRAPDGRREEVRTMEVILTGRKGTGN